MSLVGNRNARYKVVVSCQKVLAVRVIQVSTHNGAASDADIVLRVGMQEDRVVDLATEPNSMVKFHNTVLSGSWLSIDHTTFALRHLLLLHHALTLGNSLLGWGRLHLLLCRFHLINLNLL